MPSKMFLIFMQVILTSLSQVSGDNLPSLEITPAKLISVEENSPVGTYIGTLIGKDSDPGEVLTIEMVPNTNTESLVQLSAPEGDPMTALYVNITLYDGKLDRDYEPAVRPLYFRVRDRKQYEYRLRADIFIVDVNDVKPTFVGIPYTFKVYENETIGTSLFRVSSTDPDEGYGGIATYSLTDPLAMGNPFNLSQSDVLLAGKLNFSENSFYQLKVHATDRAEPYNEADPVDLIVNVLDVQNMPPYFMNLPYTASIEENSPRGRHVLTIYALDGDRGVPNEIEYFFVDGEEHNFTMNSTTGEITVYGDLDADDPEIIQKGGVFRLTVNASEVIPPGQVNEGMTWSTTTVSITLIDVNDNTPTFSKPMYEASIPENSPRGIPVSMNDGTLIEVYDLDQIPEHHSFELIMDNSNEFPTGFDTIPSPLTPVFSKASVILKVNDSKILDYETRTNITVKIHARDIDTNQSSSTSIIIHIQDVNDNSPVFEPGHPTSFSVYENVERGTYIASMTATDAESDVTYSIDGDDDGAFHIDGQTGNLTVAGDIDRETRASYTLFIIATDIDPDPNQQRSTRLKITIQVLDVNDNAPEFIEIPNSRQIPEDSAPGTELFRVRATDKDNGTNQEIVYSLAPDTNMTGLSIHPDSGMVTVNQSLAGLTGDRYIRVVATDKGVPPLNNSAVIFLVITSVNLNRPVFYVPDQSTVNVSMNMIPEFTIDEEVDIGTEIVQLYANDTDYGDNGLISYRLVPDSTRDWQRFFVDRQTGSLTSANRLDREEQETYQFTVSASDFGIPSLETSIKIRVILNDIDDNDPIFEDHIKQPHELMIYEEQANIDVGNLSLATDKDSIPIICYYILGGELPDYFTLNKTSGILTLIKPLDREVLTEVNLVILTSGDCSQTVPPTSSTREDFINGHPPEYDRNNKTLLWLRIIINDINDQPPVFAKDKLTFGFLYDVDYGTIIKELRDEVTDADIGANAVTYFKLLKPITTRDMDLVIDANNPPLLLSINGSIKTNMLFSSDMMGAFILQVQAYDIGNLTDDANVEVYLISDIQRVKIVFMKTPNQVRAFKYELKEELEKIFKFKIIVDKITTHQDSSGAPITSKTDMFIHARYFDTDKVVPAAELWRAFDYSKNIHLVLDKYGVISTEPVYKEKSQSTTVEEKLRKSLIIVTVGLAVIAILLVIVLINMRSRYRRKLRAASTKTYTSATDAIPDLIPPGTNKYLTAASNPVYMKDVNVELSEDKVSQNSLDMNEVTDEPVTEVTFDPEEQEVVMALYEEVGEDRKDPNRNSTLDVVLQQYDDLLQAKPQEETTHVLANIKDLEQTDI